MNILPLTLSVTTVGTEESNPGLHNPPALLVRHGEDYLFAEITPEQSEQVYRELDTLITSLINRFFFREIEMLNGGTKQ